MRRMQADEYTDGEHGWLHDKTSKDKTTIGDLNLATWKDYRASLAQRFIEADNPEWKMPPETPASVPNTWPNDLPTLHETAWNHILYGDREKNENDEWKYRGAHLSEYSWIANGTPFPSDWTAEQVLDIVEKAIREGSVRELGSDAFESVFYVDDLRIRVYYSHKRVNSIYAG